MRSPWSLLQAARLQISHGLMFFISIFLLSLLWPRVTLLGLCTEIYTLKRKCLQLSSGSNVLSEHALDMVTDIAELCSFICVHPGTSRNSLVTVQVLPVLLPAGLSQDLMVPAARPHPSPRGSSDWHCHTSYGSYGVLRVSLLAQSRFSRCQTLLFPRAFLLCPAAEGSELPQHRLWCLFH